MLRRLHFFLLLSFCALFTCYWITPPSQSQGSNQSVLFNGTTSLVSVPYNANGGLNITGAITMEAWIKTNSSAYQQIIERGEWGEAEQSYMLRVGDGKVRMDLYPTSGGYVTLLGATTITTGVWHHVAGVWDGTQMRVYLDGVLDGTLAHTTVTNSNARGLRIGRSSNTYYPFTFDGRIDEVRVSNAAIYTSNFTPSAHLTSTSNTKGLWKFDGQTPNDFSPNGNNGTLQGGATYSTDVPIGPNNSPAITLTDPQNNTTFSSGSTIVIDATASDSDGSVSQVEFFQGGTLLGTDTTAPYTYLWNNVAAGSYAITARATDDLGATTTSTPITITVTTPEVYHSAWFSGPTPYVDVPYRASGGLNITGAITMEAWIKTNSSAYQQIVERGEWGEAEQSYMLRVGDGKVRMDLYPTSGGYVTLLGATTITTGVWHHVAGVWDGTQMRVYLDGVLDGTLAHTTATNSNARGLRIGRSSNTYYPFTFDGRIDEVRVSNAAIYTSNFTPSARLTSSSSTKGLWKFDGQTANDFSPNGNNGTLQGGATYSTDVPSSSGGSQPPVAVPGGPYNGQAGQAIQFSSTGSFDPNGTITSYHWNFGDGTSGNTANPSHSYSSSGLFTATLTVTDNSGLLASSTAVVTMSGSSQARLDPVNQTGGDGENPLSRNFNWSLPLVSLAGRAGLDLNIGLSYNSLVWTKSYSNSIRFDDDRGWPAPGFRLGFPVIQELNYNQEVGKYGYLLIGTDGSRTELRQVGNSTLFESADSAHILLDTSLNLPAPDDDKFILRTTDGTRLLYAWKGDAYQCTEIKDRNGNYLTINYTAAGRIANIIDTLSRTITFNYAGNGSLTSITQSWSGQQQPHTWASFEYTSKTIQTSFSGLSPVGPSTIQALTQVTLADGTRFNFDYTSWGQVWKISNFAADNHLLNYRSYNLPLNNSTSQTDCPRFTERRDWAENWNRSGTAATGYMLPTGAEQEVVTSYIVPNVNENDTWTMPDGSGTQTGTRAQITVADGTADKVTNEVFFIGSKGSSSGWRRGLPALVNTYDNAGVLQRQVMTTWKQDDETVSYWLNPRVEETNIYDPSGNRKRARVSYQTVTLPNGMSCKLPDNVYEYKADATNLLRRTHTDYNLNPVYLNARIIGLVSEKTLYARNDATQIEEQISRIGFQYDGGSLDAAAPVQHDNTNYGTSFETGRANLTSVTRYDVFNGVGHTRSTRYNTAGSVVSTKDPLNHEETISYADAFSDGTARNTLAYPTAMTDPDGFSSSVKYNFDFGAPTWKQTPLPNATTNTPGPVQTISYDSVGRVQQISNSVNNAYTRFEYSTSHNRVDTYVVIQEISSQVQEAHSFKILDGLGRVFATASDHPSTANRFAAQLTLYDALGRAIKTSNPTETAASQFPTGSIPAQWTPTGADNAWKYVAQTYDWKGRPLVTTNQDGTTKAAVYSGCGCAGGEVVTLTDEGTVVEGVAKQRQQRIYSDILGRPWKAEVLNWNGTGLNGTGSEATVYSTSVTTYNGRDQVTRIRQYEGTELSPTFQDTTMGYDGFGRLTDQHEPHQQAEPNNTGSVDHTRIFYNADDTIASVIDARGVLKNFTYNNRHLVTGINYNLVNIPTAYNHVAPTADQVFTYDIAGNRKSMSDGSGTINYQYDSLSQLTSETRYFAGPLATTPFALNYQYNLAGQLKKITDHTTTTINYDYSKAGAITGVTGENNLVQSVSQYASGFEYRAWGALKDIQFGNNTHQQTDYNDRLLPIASTLSNLFSSSNSSYVMSWNDYYYLDGRQKQSIDANDDRFSRKFEYDHVGRLTEAYSGREADGQLPTSPADNPFRQSFQYNAFDERTQKNGRFWRTAQSGSTPCVPRQTNDGCDGEGNLLTFQSATHVYDAQGMQINFTDSRQTVGGESPNHPIVQPAIEIAQSYDANGQPAKRLETRRSEALIGSGPNTNITESVGTTYYIYSSVLGAKVVELDENGQKITGYVYANGTRLAKQTIQVAGSSVTWHHANPGSNSWIETDTGRNAGRQEMDPDGGEVGTSDPWVAPPEPPTYENLKGNEPLYIEGGDPFDYVSGYTLDGMPMTKGQLDRIFGKAGPGGLLSAVPEDVRPQGIDRLYWLAYYLPAPDLQRGGKASAPEKPTPAVTALVNSALAKTPCLEFMKAVLNAASTKDNPVLEGGDIQKIFNDFLAQTKGGLSRLVVAGADYGAAEGRIGMNGDGDGVIHAYLSSGNQDLSDAVTILNELVHLAGSRGGWPKRTEYDDYALAQATHGIPSYDSLSTLKGRYDDNKALMRRWPKHFPGPKNPFEAFPGELALKNRENMEWSNYFHDIVMQKCPIQ